LGAVSLKPFFEENFERLPAGVFYNFNQIFISSQFKSVSREVQTIMELEYMLQIEFSDGFLIQNWNDNYYNDNNINKFERLAESLPELPIDIKQIKNRYIYIELPKIKDALERNKNPGENYLRARENLKDIFR
jgi:hypothetical protein